VVISYNPLTIIRITRRRQPECTFHRTHVMRILLLFLVFSSASAFAQQVVPEVQKPLVTKVTATWCPPCGSWGWDLFENLVDDNESSAVLIAGHYSGSDLETVAGNEIADNFGLSGQPTFFLGNNRQAATSGTSAMARTNIKAAIDAEVATSPIANATVTSISVNNRQYTFQATTQFFQATNGEFSLAVYAVEDDVVNFQSSRGANAVHKRVLRGNIDGQTTFGATVLNGAAAVGDSFSNTFTFDFPTTWDIDNVRLVPVLWIKNGTAFDFLNANEIESTSWKNLTSSTTALTASDYRITGFGESGILTTSLDLAIEAQDVSVELYDSNGRLLSTRQLGNTPSGKTEVVWDDLNLPAGLVLVRLRTSEGERSAKVILR